MRNSCSALQRMPVHFPLHSMHSIMLLLLYRTSTDCWHSMVTCHAACPHLPICPYGARHHPLTRSPALPPPGDMRQQEGAAGCGHERGDRGGVLPAAVPLLLRLHTDPLRGVPWLFAARMPALALRQRLRVGCSLVVATLWAGNALGPGHAT